MFRINYCHMWRDDLALLLSIFISRCQSNIFYIKIKMRNEVFNLFPQLKMAIKTNLHIKSRNHSFLLIKTKLLKFIVASQLPWKHRFEPTISSRKYSCHKNPQANYFSLSHNKQTFLFITYFFTTFQGKRRKERKMWNTKK